MLPLHVFSSVLMHGDRNGRWVLTVTLLFLRFDTRSSETSTFVSLYREGY